MCVRETLAHARSRASSAPPGCYEPILGRFASCVNFRLFKLSCRLVKSSSKWHRRHRCRPNGRRRKHAMRRYVDDRVCVRYVNKSTLCVQQQCDVAAVWQVVYTSFTWTEISNAKRNFTSLKIRRLWSLTISTTKSPCRWQKSILPVAL